MPPRLRKAIWNHVIVPIIRLNTRPIQRKSLPNDLKKELMKRFKPEVVKLSDLIGRDLEVLWGYENV
ncbi:hypothetical protein [Thermococcus thioreducens]|uniref:hypothetical protein n=1 Tax=Thermococcus thioreducens TaxID=277988 RepID=UPI000A4BD175|nr:hypothetical protein [Thermococcus thioreducens]